MAIKMKTRRKKQVPCGVLIYAENKGNKPNSSCYYCALQVEECDSKGQKWLLMTPHEYSSCPNLVLGDLSSRMKKGKLYPITYMSKPCFMVKIQHDALSEAILVLSKYNMKIFTDKALNNKSSIPSECSHENYLLLL